MNGTECTADDWEQKGGETMENIRTKAAFHLRFLEVAGLESYLLIRIPTFLYNISGRFYFKLKVYVEEYFKH
jgi:hypothetical protein